MVKKIKSFQILTYDNKLIKKLYNYINLKINLLHVCGLIKANLSLREAYIDGFCWLLFRSRRVSRTVFLVKDVFLVSGKSPPQGLMR